MELIQKKQKTDNSNKQNVFSSVEKFISWLKENNFLSYDQYDFWSTKYGIKAKEIYYKNKVVGGALVAPIFFSEIFFPTARKLFVSKKRFPIADAHFILAFLNMFEISQNSEYLDEAKKIANDLLKNSIKGYSGYTWGYPFDWMTTRGLWTSGIPLITSTAYCFEAYLKLFDLTNEQRYFDIAYSNFLFTLKDLRDTPIDAESASCSYSPVDNSQIINANAYRSFVLTEGAVRFNENKADEKALFNINFVVKNQNEDGSWKYAVNDERDNFVDNFHTCFVLKNLIKVNKIKNDAKISFAIKKGYDFYKKNLLDASGSPIPFAKLSRLNIVKKELYDYAEGISLGLLMKENDEDALNLAESMVADVINKFQNNNGSFITRVSAFNIKNKIPYLRWPQSQLFYALTNYLKN
ncbi:MAG: hypothetical protein ACTHJN_16260 [Ginsengibacter sp.]